MSDDIQLDNTLLDDKWKDSFDRLLEPRGNLRKLNILKKDVNVSYNFDSSIENSKCFIDEVVCSVPVVFRKRNDSENKRISTPLRNNKKTIAIPFKCSLSPVNSWRFNCFTNSEIICRNDAVEKSSVLILGDKVSKIQGFIDETPKHNCIQSPPNHYHTHKSEVENLKNGDISEQLRKIVSRKISKCRKSVSVLKTGSHINFGEEIDYCDLVFERCHQNKPLCFDSAFDWKKAVKKIGEGAYGEVFMFPHRNNKCETGTVLKIIPIEGSVKINDEAQKTFEQILPEIVTTIELSNLREGKLNMTKNFVNIKKVSCLQGKYPDHLIHLWEEYNKVEASENDNPKILPKEQLYIALELNFGGINLECFVFNNAEQAYLVLQQVILSLAVAEEALQFEHRDLHLGNVLVATTARKNISFVINGQKISVPSGGIIATIIDYTLSRITFENCCLYNDLSNDKELFEAIGDYQYEVYRQMREIVRNDWKIYEPKTNIFWIYFVIKKMINGIFYKNIKSKKHEIYLEKLQYLKNITLTFKNSLEFANYLQSMH